jgi:hypothetical protein
MSRFLSFSAKGLLSVLLLAALCAFPVWCGLLTNPYMAAALIGSFVIHLSDRPRPRSILASILLSASFASLYGFYTRESLLSIYSPAFLGVGSLAVQALTFLWGKPERRADQGRALAAGAIFPLFLFLMGFGLAIVDSLNPKTFDHALYVFDRSLGFAPSFAVGQLLATVAWLRYACYYAYEFHPLAMSLAFVLEKNRLQRWSPNLLSVFVTAGLWGYLVYHLYPATGPIHVWPELFPWHPPQTGAVPLGKFLVTPSSRNAMPSLHFGMALVIWMISRNWWICYRIVAGILLGLVALATLGLGEHYLIDLVVAVPFVVSIVASCTPAVPLGTPTRSWPAFGGAVLSAAWIVVLRAGVPLFESRPLLAWTSILLTVVVPLLWEARLAQSAAAATPSLRNYQESRADCRQLFGLVGATE